MRKRILIAGCAAFLSLCLLGDLVSSAPPLPSQGPAIALVSAPLPTIGFFGRHTWLLVNDGRGWERWEVWQSKLERSSGFGHVQRNLAAPLAGVGAGGVRIEWTASGPALAKAIDCVRRKAKSYADRDNYLVVPGPNSNTFVDVMIRSCEIGAPMRGTAVGKDWRGWVGVSLTREGTGVQVETALLGISLGLREGVELHLLGGSAGVDLWPPALILPWGDGRFGWDG